MMNSIKENGTKKMGKLLLTTILIAIMVSIVCIPQGIQATPENSKMKISVRIEGIEENFYYKTEEIPYTGTLTLKDALIYIDDKESDLEIKGLDTNYITEINGETAGKFGGWDGWLFTVNGEEAAAGIDALMVNNNDKVVLYYGDPYGVGMQFPEVDISKLSEGVIKFTSKDTTYDENYNPTTTINPVVGAKVTWYYGDKSEVYTTDDKGEIKILSDKMTEGEHKLQITKKNEAGAPLVLRFASDYVIVVEGAKVTEEPKQPTEEKNKNTNTNDINTKTDIFILLFAMFTMITVITFSKKYRQGRPE